MPSASIASSPMACRSRTELPWLLSGETRGLVGGLFELEEFVGPGQRGGPAQAWRALAEHPVESRFRAQRGSAAATPMVGRDEELALLLRRWRLAEAGEGQAVLLVGEPGIGKSRVAEALVRTLGGEAHRTVRYQASPQHPHSALWPVAHQPARAAGLAATGDDGAGHHLGRLEAVLADLPGGRRAEALPFLAELLGIAAA